MRSSSTQPPDTEPATWPSSRTASNAPAGRGAEPHVSTTVASTTRRPCLSHWAVLLKYLQIDAVHDAACLEDALVIPERK